MSELPRIGILIAVAVLLRCSTSFHPYSGEGKPPMFGDYEAQRHWQEITINLPIEKWYKNTSDNDLHYWGLDYPPLTAYHSFLIGKIANSVNKTFIELHESRGFESEEHKYFMRLTVLVADLLIYIPSIIIYYYKIVNFDKTPKFEDDLFDFRPLHYYILTALIYPGIYLIDHGHFQYNSVSLGFFIIGVTAVLNNSITIGSFFYVLALNYKQMELYHSLPFFFYILGICKMKFKKSVLSALKMFITVAFTVLITFLIIWAPFIHKWPACVDVIVRLFPVDRGVFEDKVANFWCTLNIAVKLKKLFSHYELAKICFFVTISAVLTSNIDIFLRASREKFLLSLINTSLGFFLFSFQVHEKSILLVSIPILLYFHNDPFICYWFLLISTFSMIPLLIKDNLIIAFCGSMIFYTVAVNFMFPELIGTFKHFNSKENTENYRKFILKFLFYSSMAAASLLFVASIFLNPPRQYPDLFPLLVSVYSCIHFCGFFVYFNYKQIFLVSKKIKIK